MHNVGANAGWFSALITYGLWPTLYLVGIVGTSFAFSTGHPVLWFNVVYLSVVITIAIFERVYPYERAWLRDDHETGNNIAHTLLSKGLAQLAGASLSSVAMETAIMVDPAAGGSALWPSAWPMFFQIVLGMLIAEFGLYWAHRIAHEWPFMWRFHALHHSVTRLWVINTGRFHLADTIFKVALSQIPLYLLGAPVIVFLWGSAMTAFTGLLTHCNIDVRTGPLDWFFSTPALHRWHHSKIPAEGNKNYTENLVIWDIVFGTYFKPNRRPPVDIGIDGVVDPTFWGQLIQPFTTDGVTRIMNPPTETEMRRAS